MYLFANLLLCVAAVSVQTMARRERTTRLTALHKIHSRIPIRIPFARPDINRQSAPMAISVAASCAPAIAMTTATPKPRSLPAALPTPRHAHIFVSKRCAQSVKHPKTRPGDFVCRVLFNRLFVIGRHSNRLCGAASQSISLRASWQCNRHGSIPWLEASLFRFAFQAVFSRFNEPCAFRPDAMRHRHAAIKSLIYRAF